MRRCLVLAVALCGLLPAGLFADASAPLLPLLVELPGWEGNEAEGFDMSASGARAVMASRSYESGDKSLDVTILFGIQAQTAWNPGYKEGFKVENPGGVMEVRRINGFLAYYTFDNSDTSAGVVVLLHEGPQGSDTGGVLVLSFEGVPLDDALKIAQRFDWKKMKATLAAIK